MDIQKQHEDFDLWWEGNAIAMMCEEDEALKIWQAAKAQAVPEGFVLVNAESLALHAKSIRMFNNSEEEDHCEIENHVCAIEAMIEAQEQNQ